MASRNTKTEVFRKIKEDPENRKCFDCCDPEPSHSSVNNGILLCSRCAQAHSELGKAISFVKPLDDNWNISQLKFITAGGNSSMQSFFNMYDISKNSEIPYKYRTVAAKYYREMLKVMAEGNSCYMVTPSNSEGRELMEEFRPPEPELPQETRPKSTTLGSIGEMLGSVYSSTVEKSRQVSQQLSKNQTYKAFEETFSKIGESIKRGAQHTIEYGQQGVNFLTKEALSTYDNLTQTAAETYHSVNSNERILNLKKDTMQMLNDLEASTLGNLKSQEESKE